MTIQKFNPERTFGIEIEFVAERGRSEHQLREQLAEMMTRKGVTCHSEYYNHRTSNDWKVITDSSCGSELVSPPLKGLEGLKELKIATDSLKQLGAKVNKKCGLHIHHDINELAPKQVASVFTYYMKYENTIDSFLPNSRRGNNNRYCKSLFNHIRGHEEVLRLLQKVETMDEISRIWSSRYVKLNFHSYVKYGTLEFRQHSGTIEYEKIYNWILLTQQFVEKGKKTNARINYNSQYDTIQHLSDTFGFIKSEGASVEIAEMYKWYRKRAAALAA